MAILIGTNAKNTLTGTGSDDTLNGLGGADIMRGGLGADLYYVDQNADVVYELLGEGQDTVRASVSHTLALNVEDLELTGIANIEGTGNAQANSITGNAGDNVLRGGLGNDTMDGGAGDDAVAYTGAMAEYSLGMSTGGRLQITDINLVNGNDGMDSLIDIEQVIFSDITLSVDFDDLPEFKVNTTNAGDQSFSNVTGLAGGGFVIVWQSPQDGSNTGIYAQRYDAEGVALGVEFQINTTFVDDQRLPEITALADGGFIVSWFSDPGDLYLQRYDASGSTLGTEVLVTATSTDVAMNSPGIASLTDGGFILAWGANDGDNGGIRAQRYDADGNAVGSSEFVVNTTTAGAQFDPRVAGLAYGGFVVAWDSANQDGDGSGIFAQIFDADGDPVGTEFQVNTTTLDDQGTVTITALNNGGFVIAWESDGQDGDGFGVYAQIYDPNGDPVGTEFQVNSHIALDQRNSDITALADGGFVIVWESEAQDSDFATLGIYAQRYDAEGNTYGDEIRVNSFTDTDQSAPHISATADGGFVVSWTSFDQDGDQDGIYAQRFGANGQPYRVDIEGNAGNNNLAFTGGSAYMKGGLGNDKYTVDDAGDVVIEAFNAGTDTVKASVSYALSSNVEKLKLLGDATFDINATGNSLNNIITGNAGDNTLDGGAGIDNLRGGLGNDTYVVGDLGEVITEVAGGGTDTVIATVKHTLAAEVENLELIGVAGLKGTGNVLNNVITGSLGNDKLNGGTGGKDTLDGGLGADSLTGGTGKDKFVFSTTLGPSNIDLISDFNVASDDILLDNDVFSALGLGVLAGGAFALGAVATEADDRILYNASLGQLFYDADGVGGAVAQQFATVTPNLAITAADFSVID